MSEQIIDQRPESIRIVEDYGDAWHILVQIPDDLADYVWTAVFSATEINPLTATDMVPLAIDPHDTEPLWFYIGQERALTGGYFRIVGVADGEPLTALSGRLDIA